MIQRLKQALSKLFFCMQVSGNAATFFKLLYQTKRFKQQRKPIKPATGTPCSYNFHIYNKDCTVYLRTAAGDIAVFYEIFWLHVYKVRGINFSAFRTIVDAGANMGMATLFFKSVSPYAAIYAIEPDPANFLLLQKNTASYKEQQSIIALQAAVAATDGELSLQPASLAYNTKVQNEYGGEKVAALSLNTLIQQFGITTIDVLKMDVEGFEHVIFSSNLQWLSIVSNIIIEIHSVKDYEVCMKAFATNGFQVQKLKKFSEGIDAIYWARK